MSRKLVFLFVYLGTYSATIAELLSAGRPASQSSNYGDAVAGRAVDGDTNTNAKDNSCSHTDCCADRLDGAEIRVGDDVNVVMTNPQCGGPITNAETSAGPEIDRQCNPPLDGRYVNVLLPPYNYLTLCEVQVFGVELLSAGRPATQSSNYGDAVAGRAVDGDTNTNAKDNSCSHTDNQAENWWKVDLGKSYLIYSVKIYNRQDCCPERLNGATIHVGDNDNGMQTNAQCGEPVSNADTSAGSVIVRECNPALNGRYVSVSLPNNYLTLCEVEVYGLELAGGSDAEGESEGETENDK